MIKTLILVRHSKAENRGSSVSDFNRSLTAEGNADSLKMANFLCDAGIIPDFIVTSSATRAFETAMIFASVYETNKKNILATRTLYYCSSKTILDQIYGLPDTVDCIMVVAHNPAISDLNRKLSDGKSSYMDNTQVSILEYEMENWYNIDEHKPITFRTKRPLEITP
jgi:phosphohistidine phosphatase